MSFCLLPEKVAQFKADLKSRALDVNKLLNMSTEDITAVLEKYAGKDAPGMTREFESKIILKNRMRGLENWMSKYGEQGRYAPAKKAEIAQALSEYRAAQQERIFSPKENESYLNSLADKRIGIHIGRDVAAKVFTLTSELSRLKDQGTDNLSGVSDEYLKKRNELNQYVQSQMPTSRITSTLRNLAIIGRNNLLLNPSTPLKTTIGQITNTLVDVATRRVAALSKGGANPELAKQAFEEAKATTKATGNNTASMESLDDTHKLGKGEDFNTAAGPAGREAAEPGIKGGFKELFKTTKEAITKPGIGNTGKVVETAVRRLAQASNKVAIDWEHNATFTRIHQATFFDSANLESTKLAGSEGLKGTELKSRAAEIFKDAVRIEPQTREGAMTRMAAQKEAARVTATNENAAADLAMWTKNNLNKIGAKYMGGFPLGSYIEPMAKIPATVIANGIDSAGVGIPIGVKDFIQGRRKMASEDATTRYEGVVQFGKGVQRLSRITGTLALAALLTSQLKKDDFRSDRYGNSYVRIAGTWINTEYIAPFAPALAGMMTAKQKATSASEIPLQYVAGAGKSLLRLPGLNEPSDIASSIADAGSATAGVEKYAKDFFTSRGVPAFLKNLTAKNPIQHLFFGGSGLQSDKQYQASQNDWSKSTSKELQQFQQNVGAQKFQEANDKFNTQYTDWITSMRTNSTYQNLSDDDKIREQTNKKDEIQAKIFKEYSFTYSPFKTTKLPKL